MTDPLERLFASSARVKLMRLFLFNPHDSFSASEAAARTRAGKAVAVRELKLLSATGLLRRAKNSRMTKFSLNENFAHRAALQALLLNAQARAKELPARVRSAGAMRLIVVSGAFMGDLNAALDILFVGERINEKRLRLKIRALESELGRELSYASLSPADFFYRLNVSDRLLRDVLDFPHAIVFDRLHIGLK